MVKRFKILIVEYAIWNKQESTFLKRQIFREINFQNYVCMCAQFEKTTWFDFRPDVLTSLRPVSISTGSINTADGSAVVKQGETIVVCGIKLEIAEPKAETPKSGYIVPRKWLNLTFF